MIFYYLLNLFISEGRLNTLVSLSWDEGKTAGVNLDVLYDYKTKLFLSVNSQVYTPLTNWKVTTLGGT